MRNFVAMKDRLESAMKRDTAAEKPVESKRSKKSADTKTSVEKEAAPDAVQ
jgi:hypothetical protein